MVMLLEFYDHLIILMSLLWCNKPNEVSDNKVSLTQRIYDAYPYNKVEESNVFPVSFNVEHLDKMKPALAKISYI